MITFGWIVGKLFWTYCEIEFQILTICFFIVMFSLIYYLSSYQFYLPYTSTDHHGPPKVNFWDDPLSPSKWKEEHVCFKCYRIDFERQLTHLFYPFINSSISWLIFICDLIVVTRPGCFSMEWGNSVLSDNNAGCRVCLVRDLPFVSQIEFEFHLF